VNDDDDDIIDERVIGYTRVGDGPRLVTWQLLPTDLMSKDVRPETVLAALMQQAPGDPLLESLEDVEPLTDAIAYAAECLNAEDTFILNAINSEGLTYDELAERLGLSRSRTWRLHERAIKRLRTLLLNHPPVRERLRMEPTWNAAAMQELVAIAGYEEGWDDPDVAYTTVDAAADVCHHIDLAIAYQQEGKENWAVRELTTAAQYSVAYLRCVGKWSLLDEHNLLCSKQADYGHGNILRFGFPGVMVRCSDKAERLKNLVTTRSGVKPRNESVLDTFFDVIGYAVIARMLKAETFELELDTTEGGEREKAS